MKVILQYPNTVRGKQYHAGAVLIINENEYKALKPIVTVLDNSNELDAEGIEIEKGEKKTKGKINFERKRGGK